MSHVLGVTLRLSFKFTDTAGADADPTVVTVYVSPPNQGRTKYVYGVDGALVKDSTGDYHLDVVCNKLGKWHYQVIGSGVVTVTSPTNWSFDVVREPE